MNFSLATNFSALKLHLVNEVFGWQFQRTEIIMFWLVANFRCSGLWNVMHIANFSMLEMLFQRAEITLTWLAGISAWISLGWKCYFSALKLQWHEWLEFQHAGKEWNARHWLELQWYDQIGKEFPLEWGRLAANRVIDDDGGDYGLWLQWWLMDIIIIIIIMIIADDHWSMMIVIILIVVMMIMDVDDIDWLLMIMMNNDYQWCWKQWWW